MRNLFFLFLSLLAFLDTKAQLESLIVDYQEGGPSITINIYRPREELEQTRIHYFTDGNKLLDNGILESLIEHETSPAYYVFVSTIDPVSGLDHRNEYFFCNPVYLEFFEEQVLPLVEQHLGLSFLPAQRSLIGVSFGGLNAAYFSGINESFQKYVLLSPVTYPCKIFKEKVVFSTNQDLKIFLSTGTKDAELYVRELEALYRSKGYTLETIQTEGGHDFENWLGQMTRVMQFLSE